MMSALQPSRFAKKISRNQTGRNFSGSETDVSTSTENLSHEERYVIRHTARQEPQGQEHLPPPGGTPSNRSSLDVSNCSYNTLIIHAEPDMEGKRVSHHFDRSITDIPDDYLSQSQVLKHLAKEAKSGGPTGHDEPPRYKGLRRDKLQMSKSQPDLRFIAAGGRVKYRGIREDDELIEVLRQDNSRLRLELESYVQKLSKTEKLEQEFNKVHRAQEELVQSSERRGRLEREARTRLQTDCRRMQEMNRTLRDQVEVLSSQLLSSRVPTGDAVRRELNNRDILITQLIASNKELSAAKERQEIELAAQRATLQEQRTHIDILDTALTNAQGNVVRLEEECRKKQMYVELVSQLKQALVAQQQASDRREQTEQMLRLQLERELRAERAKSAASDSAQVYGSGASGSCSSSTPMGESSSELKRKLREREEKIMFMEKENAKWEQRYIEESALRQAAIEAASLPKDAKIAALEKTSQETERMIAEARSEKMRHMDEQHAAQKRVADLESRVKDLESRLAERDAMIKVLQKHTYDKDVSSSYPGIGFSDLSRQDLGPSTSVFSTVSSALTSSTGFTSFSGCSDSSGKLFHTSSYHAPTSVSDSGGKLGYHGGDSASKLSYGGDSSSKLSFSGDSFHGADTTAKIGNYGSFRGQYGSGQSFDETKKSLDDQLKELDSQLDSQLLSKRGLCCFPGFSNPSAASRKGKISQPLLAGVVGLGGLARNDPPARPEEMMLLEKQGRSSQRQRAGSLPPSSLPRPRRPRKLGEYGRLSDSETNRKTSTDDDHTGSLGYGSHDRKLGEYGRLGDGDLLGKAQHDEPTSRPPTAPSSYSFSRLQTPPVESCKLDYVRKPSTGDETPPRTPGTPTKLEFVNFPRLKTPPIDSPFLRKQIKDDSPAPSSSPAPAFVSYTRYKTPPAMEPPGKLDLSRKTPPKGFAKKSFIPPPRKLGEYGRLATRSSSDSSPATPRTSGEPRSSSLTRESPTPTPNYRIRF